MFVERPLGEGGIAVSETRSLEERKFALDAELRRRQMTLDEAKATSTGLSPALASIAGAILTVLGGAIGAGIGAWSTQNVEAGRSESSIAIERVKVEGTLALERSKQQAVESLERKKFETALIMETIKTPSREDAIRNLKFFVAAGFIDDAGGKIRGLSDRSLPSISQPSSASATRALQTAGQVTVVNAGQLRRCTAVAIAPDMILTTDLCVMGSTSTQFEIARTTRNAKVLETFKSDGLALLQLDQPVDVFLDKTRLREPVQGEPIYFAKMEAGRPVPEVQTCQVTELSVSDHHFLHDCKTGPGTSGSMIIAVRDDALLGIHYGSSNRGGRAMRLPKALSNFDYKPGAADKPK